MSRVERPFSSFGALRREQSHVAWKRRHMGVAKVPMWRFDEEKTSQILTTCFIAHLQITDMQVYVFYVISIAI